MLNWIRRKNTKNAYIEFEKLVRCGEPCYKVLTFKNFPKIDDCTKELFINNSRILFMIFLIVFYIVLHNFY